jgi:PAS domain S-box-containing protein
MPERYRDDHTKGLNHAVGHGKSAYFGKTMEFHGLRKDGGEFPLELNISQWKSNGGLYFSGVIRDITERKDAEKSIRNSEAKLNAIFNSTLDGILVADTESKKFLTGNKAICEMLGYTLQELVELEVDDIHPAESLRYIHEQFELQARKEIKISAEIPVKRKDGTIFVADIVLSPMQISDKNFLIGVFRDATQRHEDEARIRQSQKLEAIGTLAGGIAHDFNNILAAILGYGELALEDSKQGTAVHDELQQVIKAGNRARELIKQILTLSRQTTMETSPQRIQVIVKEVLKLLRATIPTTIEIRQNIDNDCDPVLADPTQIHQILMNLCTNAFHAMEQTGGVLEVALQRIDLAETDERRMPELKPGRYVQLDVIDTGPGMIKDVMDHIFEPYYTTKPLGKGSGLGLAVVHGIVESHGGKIGCKSEPGSGTVFSVFLPVVEMTFETGYEKKPVLPTGNERILFVDDEESLALLGKKKLEPLGYTVFPVTSSTQALQMVQDSPQGYDLVITDQTMPRMSGEILAQKLFAIRPDIPVILCTGFSSVITEELAKSIGIKAFLIKPVDNQVLAETIRKVLDS